MTFTLASLRDDVEADLRDSANASWSTAELDRAIAQALAQYGSAAPQQLSATLTVTGRTADLSAASPAGLGTTAWNALIRVAAAEYPVGTWPPTYVRFELFGSTLTLHTDTALSAASVKVYHENSHLLDGAGGTIPDRDRELLAIGSAAYALRQLVAARADALNTGHELVASLRAMAEAREAAWREGIDRLTRRVKQHRAYRPSEPFLGRDVVDFPD